MNYWYDDGEDRHECETEEQAKAGAESALDNAVDYCQSHGEWSESVGSIGWGRVVDGKDVAVERAAKVDVVEMCHEPRGCSCGKLHGEGDHEDADEGYCSDVGYTCEYMLLPVEVKP